ncbi:CGNR zinc finger domain-containing protein [Rhodococcus sp. LB1]|uniref:CGNR zinc finger domain-containing protein n=1 Tax=Rhodococcus sp. LB1 TaxID=1807499 RepID=UPI0009EE6332|nr:CGNR zinc finger domain-containing protein [Rhodococcus sp. LB1]
MHFAPDTVADLAFLVDLGNTDPGATRSGDGLPDPAALTALLDTHGYSGRFDRDDTELRHVRRARSWLRKSWSLPQTEMVDEINATLTAARALPQLVRHDGLDWHIHAISRDAPLAERITIEAAMAFSDVIRSNETDRLRVCEAEDCTGLLIDLSRNASKRFCSVRCSNRVNMIAYRSRATSS